MKARVLCSVLVLLVLSCTSSRPRQSASTGPVRSSQEATQSATELPRSAPTEEKMDQVVIALAQQIENTMVAGDRSRVAVVPFCRMDGRVSELGFYLAERLTNRLSASRTRLVVIDRFHLADALSEMRLGYSGLQNAETAQQLGRVLGADAIVVGSIAELESSFDIILRLLATETLAVLANAEGRIDQSPTTQRMWGTDLSDPIPRTTGSAASPESKPSDGAAVQKETAPGNVVFCEDFADVPRGQIPAGWRGGDAMLVKSGRGGKNELTDFESRGDLQVETPPITFPSSFDLEIDLWWDFGNIKISLGGVFVRLRDTGQAQVNETTVIGSSVRLENKLNRLRIEKRGPVFAVSLNGDEVHVGRYPEAVLRSVAFTNAGMGYPARHFGIQKVCITAVE